MEYYGFEIREQEDGWAIYDEEGTCVEEGARSLRAAQDSIDHFLGSSK
jgi:hypothetical protein